MLKWWHLHIVTANAMRTDDTYAFAAAAKKASCSLQLCMRTGRLARVLLPSHAPLQTHTHACAPAGAENSVSRQPKQSLKWAATTLASPLTSTRRLRCEKRSPAVLWSALLGLTFARTCSLGSPKAQVARRAALMACMDVAYSYYKFAWAKTSIDMLFRAAVDRRQLFDDVQAGRIEAMNSTLRARNTEVRASRYEAKMNDNFANLSAPNY